MRVSTPDGNEKRDMLDKVHMKAEVRRSCEVWYPESNGNIWRLAIWCNLDGIRFEDETRRKQHDAPGCV